jgi:hypothetical protein
MKVNGLSSALAGIQRQSDALGRAAEKVARAAAVDSLPSSRQENRLYRSSADELIHSGAVEAIVARRMFSASLRMAQAVNEGVDEIIERI